MADVPVFWCERVDGGWRRTDTGEVKGHVHDFPEGALYDAPWLREGRDGDSAYVKMLAANPDGLTLVVRTPDGAWVIDGPSFSKEAGYKPCPWSRTGDPRRPASFSVSPSIHFPGRYHGFLTAGVLRSV